jgi:DNA repair protein RadC
MERQENWINQTEVAEVELIYRTNVMASERPTVTGAKDAYEIFRQHWDAGKMELQEQFKVIYLNRANKVLCIYELSTGGICGTIVDPKLLFAAALKVTAISIIVAHNHPSGALRPSPADVAMTQKIKLGGEILDIKLIDHLILTPEGYLSFADQGLL